MFQPQTDLQGSRLSGRELDSPPWGTGDISTKIWEEEDLSQQGLRHGRWSIPWSDLMMTMFVLFAALYIYGHSHGRLLKYPSPPHPGISSVKIPSSDISRVYDLSRRLLGNTTSDSEISLELVPHKAVKILLAGNFLFDKGKAELRSEAEESLRKVASILNRIPYMVNVVGHTDQTPIHTKRFPSNWELSTARACKVARFLMEEMKVPPKRFFIGGYAQYDPVSPNASKGGLAANRRVEIIITKKRPRDVLPLNRDIVARQR